MFGVSSEGVFVTGVSRGAAAGLSRIADVLGWSVTSPTRRPVPSSAVRGTSRRGAHHARGVSWLSFPDPRTPSVSRFRCWNASHRARSCVRRLRSASATTTEPPAAGASSIGAERGATKSAGDDAVVDEKSFISQKTKNTSSSWLPSHHHQTRPRAEGARPGVRACARWRDARIRRPSGHGFTRVQ